MFALYKAAYSWRPGTAGFIPWLNTKIRGELSMLRERAAYKSKHRIRLCRIDPEMIDSRFLYR